MQITTVLFDLDGTLLPMDQDVFVRAYLTGLVKKLSPHGYDPALLADTIWSGTVSMVKNDGKRRNEEVFWTVFEAVFGADSRKDEPLIREFYENEFQDIRFSCGFHPKAAEVISAVHGQGLRAVLATNPLFPAIATESRIRWAGLKPEDFELVTAYENSRHCKPNPDYYRDILSQLGVCAEECLMVGNDVEEDMIAETLGMKVFLLTDCLINKLNRDISRYPHGNFDALLSCIAGIRPSTSSESD